MCVSFRTVLQRAPLNSTLSFDSAPSPPRQVYGSQYDMGFAYGSLMADEIKTLIPLVRVVWLPQSALFTFC